MAASAPNKLRSDLGSGVPAPIGRSGLAMFSTVELREIRVFLAVAEELHFGRAAERTGLTTSRVSQTIRVLELRAGGRLFHRTSRRVRLTPLGEQLLATAGPPCHELEQAFELIHEAANNVAGTLRLGMYSPVNGGRRMLEIVDAFEQRYPDCKVAFADIGWGQEEEEWLRSARVDMLALRLPRTASDVTIGPILTREGRVLVVRKDDPLAGRSSIGMDDLAGRTLPDVPTLSREVINTFVPPSTTTGEPFDRVAVRSMLEIVLLVASGQIVHLTVESFLEFHPHPDIVAVPIEGLPPSETALAWLSADRSPNVNAFARTAADVLAT